MANTVWKVNLAEALVHALPIGATMLHADYQDGEICIWAMVDPDARKANYAFLVSGTGWTLPDFIRPDQHIASVRNPSNRNCWHIWNLGYLEAMKPIDRRTYDTLIPADGFDKEGDSDDAE